LGIHTIDLPARGREPLRLLATSRRRTGARDAAGELFWFRGAREPLLNPRLQRPRPTSVVTYDGARRVVTGVPTALRPKPLRVRFSRPGSFTFACNVHRAMTGTVRVVGRRAAVPSAAAVRAAAAAQVAAALRTAKALVRARATPRVVSVGKAGKGGVQRYVFSPAVLTIPRGRLIRFVMPRSSREVHTVTAGPGDPDVDASSYLRKLAVSVRSPAPSPIATFPSDPPTVGAVPLTPRVHGNGFWNSGVLDAISSTPMPRDGRVRFTTPGFFRLYCLIHPTMRVLVTVK
ncbi:MAG TPA: hypothetical protein VFZ89_07800, partial [Solirubrobacteraceae bacterium]